MNGKLESGKSIPGFVYPLLFVAGAFPLWPFALRLSRPTRIWVFTLPFLTLGLPLWLSWNWLLMAPLMAGANAIFAIVFLLAHPINPIQPIHPDLPDAAPGHQESAGIWDRLRRSFGGAACGLPFGLILVSLELWLTDFLWSGYYPVNASINSIAREVGAAWTLFALVFAFTVFYLSPTPRPMTPLRILRLLLATFGVYGIVHQLHLLLVAIPVWQTEIREIFPPWVTGLREALFQLLVYIGVPVVLGSLLRPAKSRWAFGNFAAGVVSVVLALVALAWVSGMPIHYALLLGQQAEKSGRPSRSIFWYSRALTWSQSDRLKSYLQFRVGLLYRKTGRLEEARDAFTRVLVRYPKDETLLDDADEFKEKLAAGRSTQGRRVVIPGIEARTEYKSAYCVPNSLGLLLSFWGDRSGAKRIGSEITQLDRGSLITDEAHFAESRGFASLVLPLCTMDQLYRLIDAGIPVLAFIPGHVIAVFGYDEALGTLVTYDVNTFDIWDDARRNLFAADWSLTYNTLGVVVPKHLLPQVRAVMGSDVETRSEAYLSYLMSELSGNNPEMRLKFLRRSLNRGFAPAAWVYRALSGEKTGEGMGGTVTAKDEDSTAAEFLLAHQTREEAPYAFTVDQLWRGRNQSAFDFLKRLGSKKPLSEGLLTALASAELKAGKADGAAEILFRSVPFDKMDPAAATFLLRQFMGSRDEEDPSAGSVAGELSAELLGREELHGDEASLAYTVWRASGLMEGNVNDALQQVHSYLVRWHAYDTTAIRDLRETLARKSFQPNEESDERVWKKQMRLLEVRRARLQWANGG